MHECLLCKRDMSKAKDTFEKGCINNIYKFLNINTSVKLNNKEKILYQNIMEQTQKESDLKSSKKITLKESYDLYKKENKFKKKIKELLDSKLVENWDSKTKLLLARFSFIFNMQINKEQYQQDAIKEMQYAFWQTVI